MSRGEDEELRASTTAVDTTTDALTALEMVDAAASSPCAASSSTGATAFPDFTDATAPAGLRGMWSEPASDNVLVRGATYVDDQVKVSAGPSVACLLHVDVWTTATPDERHHITRFDLDRDGDASVVRWSAQHHPDALVVVLNIELPDANNLSLVSYWLVPMYATETTDDDDETNEHATFYRLLRRFVDGDDDDGDIDDAFRNARFKMIPSFTQAPWIINSLVQSRPALTGKKLTQRYFRGANYLEIAMEISSSTIAHYIGSLCQSWASYIEVDVFITVQGEHDDDLPEKILGGVRLQYMDLALAQRVGGATATSDDDSE